MYTENTLNSLAFVRDTSQLTWSVIPMVALVIYVFYQQADVRNWSRILAAIGFVLADLFNELMNSFICHWSSYAPVWGIKASSNYQFLIGWNIEILCGFLLVGLASTMALPDDRTKTYFGVNNRVVFIVINAALSVIAEIIMNKAGLIYWEWPWWSAQSPWLIFLLGYVPFFTVAYLIYDATLRTGVKIVFGYVLVISIMTAGLGYLNWL